MVSWVEFCSYPNYNDYVMRGITNLKIERNEGKVTFSLEVDSKKSRLMLSLIYNEDITFDTTLIKEIKLDENRNIFGLTYYITVVTNEMEKKMMPPLPFKFVISKLVFIF